MIGLTKETHHASMRAIRVDSAGVDRVPAPAHAQASITGVVRDASGAVLPGVTVEAASPALIEKVRSVVTDGTGQYRIENLRPGIYAVTFTLARFRDRQAEGDRADGHLHRHRQRRHARRLARGDDHGHRGVADRRRAEHDPAAGHGRRRRLGAADRGGAPRPGGAHPGRDVGAAGRRRPGEAGRPCDSRQRRQPISATVVDGHPWHRRRAAAATTPAQHGGVQEMTVDIGRGVGREGGRRRPHQLHSEGRRQHVRRPLFATTRTSRCRGTTSRGVERTRPARANTLKRMWEVNPRSVARSARHALVLRHHRTTERAMNSRRRLLQPERRQRERVDVRARHRTARPSSTTARSRAARPVHLAGDAEAQARGDLGLSEQLPVPEVADRRNRARIQYQEPCVPEYQGLHVRRLDRARHQPGAAGGAAIRQTSRARVPRYRNLYFTNGIPAR